MPHAHRSQVFPSQSTAAALTWWFSTGHPKANKSLNDVTAILLMEFAAKGVGKSRRAQLLSLLSRHGIDMDGGSRRGMPLEIPMHAVRAHGQRLKRELSTGAREHLYSRDPLSYP